MVLDESTLPAVPLYGDDLAPGALIGPYVVDAVVHVGPMATLYRALDARGQPVAVKLLHRPLSSSRRALERFALEGDVLERVRHPNVVRLRDTGTLVDGRPYLAMEWLGGEDLSTRLEARGGVGLGEATEVLEQLGAALRGAHGLGIIHRDLKAENVRVVADSPSVVVKLLDFGVAKDAMRGADARLTSTGMQMGTPVAMAPEQILGQPLDARTDVYALGVLLYQLLTGRAPFEAVSVQDLEQMHLQATPPRVSERVRVPSALDAVVATAMAKLAAERYPDVGAFLEALTAAASGGQSRPVMGLGVLAELRPASEDAPDAALERADTLVGELRQALEGLGFTVALEGPGLLLALKALPDAEEGQEPELARIRSALWRLFGTLTQRAGGELVLRLLAHRAPAEEARDANGKLTLRRTELLAPATWKAVDHAPGLLGTAAFWSGEVTP